MRTRWRSRSGDGPAPPVDAAHGLADELDVHPVTAQLLLHRGVADAEAARRFLKPSLHDLSDPADLPGCARAAERLVAAVRAGQRIVVYGDYDVDGVTASAILWHVLRLAGADVHTYVPHRIDEGYGLNAEAVAGIARGELPAADDEGDAGHILADAPSPTGDAPPLIVTVDCGITAVEPARAARELGVDLIVTDHHEFDAERLPACHTLVHPRLPTDAAHPPSPHLCGAGVAFKLAWEFARAYCGSERVPKAFRELLTDLLSYVALGTVADVVPLVGENRVLTVFGLGRIKQTRFEGLNALIDASRLRDEKIGAYHVGFVLGPRLNACGRMGHAKRAVRLLTAPGPGVAQELAEFLTQENDRRRATERAIFSEAERMVREQSLDAEHSRAIVVGKENWHPGVIGIVASRLVERFARPVVILNLDNGTAQGSARSVEGLSIYDAFNACREHIDHFGGHAMAAGLALRSDRVDAFREALVEYANERLSPADLTGLTKLDACVELEQCDLDLFRQIQRLAPFGRGNPEPRLLLRGVELAGPPQRVGREGHHLALTLAQQPHRRRAIAFGFADVADALTPGAALDVAFEPRLNEWNGQTQPELRVCDLRLV